MRIAAAFERARRQGRGALMPFVTGGFPDLETTWRILPRLAAGGASIIELGFPFSDPIADGPVVAESMHVALAHGCRVDALFDGLMRMHSTMETDCPIVAMVSCSILERFGLERFAKRASEAGVAGLIVPDLPVEESEEVRYFAAQQGLACVLLIAPTTAADRAALIAEASTGFVYVLARKGITGVRSESPDVSARIASLRRVTQLPLACGFGIGSADAVRAVTEHADGAIVGSALIQLIKESSVTDLESEVERFVRQLAAGLTRPLSLT